MQIQTVVFSGGQVGVQVSHMVRNEGELAANDIKVALRLKDGREIKLSGPSALDAKNEANFQIKSKEASLSQVRRASLVLSCNNCY